MRICLNKNTFMFYKECKKKRSDFLNSISTSMYSTLHLLNELYHVSNNKLHLSHSVLSLEVIPTRVKQYPIHKLFIRLVTKWQRRSWKVRCVRGTLLQTWKNLYIDISNPIKNFYYHLHWQAILHRLQKMAIASKHTYHKNFPLINTFGVF